jgi:hypothetical protein
VFRLYHAGLGRDADSGGLGFHTGRVEAGVPLVDVAADFLASAEFQERFGPLTNAEYVDRLYENLRGADGDPAGFAFHLGRLEAGVSRATLLVDFSESLENQANTAPQVQDGLWYT